MGSDPPLGDLGRKVDRRVTYFVVKLREVGSALILSFLTESSVSGSSSLLPESSFLTESFVSGGISLLSESSLSTKASLSLPEEASIASFLSPLFEPPSLSAASPITSLSNALSLSTDDGRLKAAVGSVLETVVSSPALLSSGVDILR